MTLNQWEYGSVSEDLVLQKYLQDGYNLVAQNFEYRRGNIQGRLGEIDLIMEKDGRVYLVEVKARNNDKYGPTSAQVTSDKLKHIYKTWQYFLSLRDNKQYREAFFQFDLAIVSKNEVKIIPNAANFDAFAKF
jgi:Holliday junction resolvase-like predicted endonuclease